jgi:hypothetical protein
MQAETLCCQSISTSHSSWGILFAFARAGFSGAGSPPVAPVLPCRTLLAAMESLMPAASSLRLPRPARGSSERVPLGGQELILEGVRGGFALLWSDGKQARRYQLGLPLDGELWLQHRVPALPLAVALREPIVLAPGARLRGYLQVPLVPTLWWLAAPGRRQQLLELPVAELAAEWTAEDGSCHRSVSPWHVRFPMRTGELRGVLAVTVCNRSSEVLSPEFVPLQLRDEELRSRRDSLLLQPRRLVWRGGEARWCTEYCLGGRW